MPEKIILRQTADKIIASCDENQYFTLDSTHLVIPNENINSKYLLGLLNSKLINYYYQKIVPEIGKAFPEVKIVNLKNLPIIVSENSYESIIDKVEILSKYSKKVVDLEFAFRNWLNLEYNAGEISNRNKLFNFWELSFEDFFKLLKKKIGKVSVKNYSIINQEFEDIVSEIIQINNEIKKINKELDDLFYEIYGLTEEEIAIVEESLE